MVRPASSLGPFTLTALLVALGVAAPGCSGGGSRYLHDFDESDAPLLGDGDDHARLATALERFKNARVVVSYYDDPRLDELYPQDRWRKVDQARHKNLASQNRRGAVKATAPEVLLVNRN